MKTTRFAQRQSKALKIRRILLDFLNADTLAGLCCLDIGCANAEITQHLADLFSTTVGLDRDRTLVLEGRQRLPALDLLEGDGSRLPFPDSSFDVVVCAQVYEHIEHAELLPGEVERVLREGGICFFSGPNKLWPVEPHYGLPFLHWLPGWLADAYLRATSRGESFDIRPFTAWHLRRLWRRFTRYDYTVPMIRQPERFGLSVPWLRHAHRIPSLVFRVIYDLLPNYNWILVKPHAQSVH